MTRKTVGAIIILIVIALVGLVFIQVSLLDSSIALKEQTFRRNVLNALGEVAEGLEARETVNTAFDVVRDNGQRKEIALFAKISHDSFEGNLPPEEMMGCFDSIAPTISRTDKGLVYCVPSPQHVILQVLDTTGALDTTLVDQFRAPGIYHVKYDAGLDSAQCTFRIETDNAVRVIQNDSLDSTAGIAMISADSGKAGFTMKVLSRLLDHEWRPIEERLSTGLLDSLLEARLNQAGVDMDYVYGVMSQMEDSLVLGPNEYGEELERSEFRTRLYPHDFLAPDDYLVLYFPEGRTYALKQVSPMLISMMAFLAIIVFCFIYTIRTVIAQKRHAALMVDFVNNMTHEFKTPISTVALACEAIRRSDIISDEAKVAQYSRLIQDENRRMRSQAEKILQMATLEEGDLELKTETVDLHAVISEAIDTIALQIENRGGKITSSLKAKHYLVAADKVHLLNIIFNLLDNANKYSENEPEISVSTWNGENHVFVAIEDHGKGISEEHLKHIFEKYYRIPTGNIHDVKGFGLGLSYVRLMVEAHHGGINLKSKPGEGTQAIISFPVLEGR